MFLSRRLKKARRDATRFLTVMWRLPDRRPESFGQTDRELLGVCAECIEDALATDDVKRIENAVSAAKETVDRRLPFVQRFAVRENIEVVLIAFVLFLLIRTFVVQAFKIPSGSMIPTLLVGDHILVNKFVYGIDLPFTDAKIPVTHPKRGDIVVFRFPSDPSKDYIKRVIGLPGDIVKISGRQVFVNGERFGQEEMGVFRYEDPPGYDQTAALRRESIGGRPHLLLHDTEALHTDDLVRRVPPGKYFCMGDNRDHSNDSRFWGFVPEANLRGKAIAIYFSWPPGQFGRIGNLLR
jgi:signal peptidase I